MDSTDLQVEVLSTAPLVVEVSGEIDIASGPKPREELLDVMRRSGARLALDLSGVTFMDCVGGSVRVLRASRPARKVLMLTGLLHEFALAGPETAEAA